MRRSPVMIILGVGVLVAVVAVAVRRNQRLPAVPTAVRTTPPAQGGPVTVISGATAIDPATGSVVPDAVIVISGTHIDRVGPRATTVLPTTARVIDAAGKFVLPGLADMHNHLRSGWQTKWENPRPNLVRLLAWGMTSTFALGIEEEAFVWLKTKITAVDAAPYARMWGSGPMFLMQENPSIDYSPRTPEQVEVAVRKLEAMHADAAKIFYDDMSWVMKEPMPMLPLDIVQTIVAKAHQHKLKVYVHAPILGFAKVALRAGVDGLLHGIISDPVDDEFLNLMRQNHAFYVSTLSLFEATADYPGWVAREAAFDQRGFVPADTYAELQRPEVVTRMRERWSNSAETQQHLPLARANLQTVFAAGIPVITGTDTGILGIVNGVSSHLELLLHVEAGLPIPDVLRAATLNAARMVGREDDLGALAPGKLADLIVLDANPLEDIRNTRWISRVVRGGTVYDPRLLLDIAELPDSEIQQRLRPAPGNGASGGT